MWAATTAAGVSERLRNVKNIKPLQYGFQSAMNAAVHFPDTAKAIGSIVTIDSKHIVKLGKIIGQGGFGIVHLGRYTV